MSRFINPVPKFVYEGEPVTNGKLYFWEVGTNTPKSTYSDPGATIPNINPVSLNADGTVPEIWLEGNYKVALYDERGIDDGELKFEIDNFEGSPISAQYSDYSNVQVYSVNDIVRANDDNYYQSLIDNNLGSEPSASPLAWQQVVFLTLYNPNKTFSVGNVTLFNGLLYSSLANNNQGNQPDLSPAEWQNYAGTNSALNVTYDNTSSSISGATAQDAIDELDTAVVANSTAITQNTTDIAALGGSPAGIAQNAADIAANTSAIAQNTSDIAANTADIATNTTDIATSASTLASTVATVGGHTTSIDSLSSSVSANSSSITSLSSSTATNSSNIAANASDISAAESTIASHTSTLSSHSSAIAGLGTISGYDLTISTAEPPDDNTWDIWFMVEA
ncbi:MAG: hypothetical protein ACRBCS_03210 [Cellvibrionaceae bacterium]